MLAHAASPSSERAASDSASAEKSTPSSFARLSCLVVGMLVAAAVLAFVHYYTSPAAAAASHAEASPAVTLHHTTQLAADPQTTAALSLATDAAAPISPQLAVRTRSGKKSPTAAELLERDVLAAGGKPLSEDSLPCAFSFHPPSKVPLAVTVEVSWDYQDVASDMQTMLEWMNGVALSYKTGLQYALNPQFNSDSPLMVIWTRFLGVNAGEMTQDDHNQRLGEGTHKVQYIDNTATIANAVTTVQERIAAMGPDVVKHKESAPPMIFQFRRLREIDSRVACLAPMQRTLRQKYCAARAMRPVPFSLYAAAPVKGKLHPIHIAVQLSSVLHPTSGKGEATSILANLPGGWAEYIDTTGLTIAQLLQALRRHTRAALHVHLFANEPLTRETSQPSALWKLEEHELLRKVIMGDAAAHSENQGMVLETHFHVSALHAFHHLVMADVLVAGWGVQALLASTLNEGIVLVPDLPHQPTVIRPFVPFYDLPVCGTRTLTYAVRRDAPDQTNKFLSAQPTKFRDFFAAASATAALNSTTATAAAVTTKDGIAAHWTDALKPSRFELPLRRMVRRRHAEAYSLTTAFDAPVTNTRKPSALIMRHCQAIPEAPATP